MLVISGGGCDNANVWFGGLGCNVDRLPNTELIDAATPHRLWRHASCEQHDPVRDDLSTLLKTKQGFDFKELLGVLMEELTNSLYSTVPEFNSY